MSTLQALRSKAELDEGVTARLDAPSVGFFHPELGSGDAVDAGRVVGRLTVLGKSHRVVAPHGAAGAVVAIAAPGAVQYGDALVSLGAAIASDGTQAAGGAAEASAEGYPVRAPIDGIFYLRPSPDAAAYVTVGDTVSEGTTLGLVEVMKTFNPVTLGGAGAPSAGTVAAILASDGDEVRADEVLFRIRTE